MRDFWLGESVGGIFRLGVGEHGGTSCRVCQDMGCNKEDGHLVNLHPVS